MLHLPTLATQQCITHYVLDLTVEATGTTGKQSLLAFLNYTQLTILALWLLAVSALIT